MIKVASTFKYGFYIDIKYSWNLVSSFEILLFKSNSNLISKYYLLSLSTIFY